MGHGCNATIDDLAIIDDEAGFAFNNGTFGGEGHKTGLRTELGNGDLNGDVHDDDEGDEALGAEAGASKYFSLTGLDSG
jgi:hypothetical protein